MFVGTPSFRPPTFIWGWAATTPPRSLGPTWQATEVPARWRKPRYSCWPRCRATRRRCSSSRSILGSAPGTASCCGAASPAGPPAATSSSPWSRVCATSATAAPTTSVTLGWPWQIPPVSRSPSGGRTPSRRSWWASAARWRQSGPAPVRPSRPRRPRRPRRPQRTEPQGVLGLRKQRHLRGRDWARRVYGAPNHGGCWVLVCSVSWAQCCRGRARIVLCCIFSMCMPSTSGPILPAWLFSALKSCRC